MAVLAACGPAQNQGGSAPAVTFGEPVTITFWHTQTGANEKALSEQVAKFNGANGKNITLKSEYQGSYTQVYQKIMAGIQAGSPPDVAVAYESMVAEYMKANAVVDMRRRRASRARGPVEGEPGRHLPPVHRVPTVPTRSTASCSPSPSPRASPSTTTTRTCSRRGSPSSAAGRSTSSRRWSPA